MAANLFEVQLSFLLVFVRETLREVHGSTRTSVHHWEDRLELHELLLVLAESAAHALSSSQVRHATGHHSHHSWVGCMHHWNVPWLLLSRKLIGALRW